MEFIKVYERNNETQPLYIRLKDIKRFEIKRGVDPMALELEKDGWKPKAVGTREWYFQRYDVLAITDDNTYLLSWCNIREIEDDERPGEVIQLPKSLEDVLTEVLEVFGIELCDCDG